ncbi:MAG TPA: hypothetical protein VEC12_02790 [Bacteroidia bacterium]|nr:hypothetical protein [Bacteroidia bacterium]
MDLATIKIDLAQKLFKIEDIAFLEYLEALLDKDKQGDSWDEMPDNIRRSLEISLQQSERGETIPHEDVMKKYEKWRKK